jgi:hypothetical protein
MLSSTSPSGLRSPESGEKHIHFHEQVEQFIALEMEGDDDEELDYALHDYGDSDSDDGGIMIQSTRLPLGDDEEDGPDMDCTGQFMTWLQ